MAIMTDRDALVAAICAAPHDDLPRLVLADWLDEHGGDGRLWRELTYAHRLASRTPPRRRPQPPDNWNAAIGRIPAEYRSWFAAGCALRCGLWLPRDIAIEHTTTIYRVLLAEPDSDDARTLADAAWAQAHAAQSQANATQSQANATQSRADAAWSRADTAWARADTAGSRACAAWAQADAAWSRAYAARAQTYAAWSRAYNTEQQWQAGWLAAVLEVLGCDLAV